MLRHNSLATCWFVRPLPHANTIRDLKASCWLLFGRRAQRASVCRSSSLKINSAFGRPRAIGCLLSREPTATADRAQDYFSEFITQDTNSLLKKAILAFFNLAKRGAKLHAEAQNNDLRRYFVITSV